MTRTNNRKHYLENNTFKTDKNQFGKTSMKQGSANLVGFPDNSSEGLDLELRQWCERTSVSMGDDITVVGVWGDAAKLNTRDCSCYTFQHIEWCHARVLFDLCVRQKTVLPVRVPR